MARRWKFTTHTRIEFFLWIEFFLSVCSPSSTGPQAEIHVTLILPTIKERDDKILRDVNLFLYSWVNTSYLLGLILRTSHRVEMWGGLGVYEPQRQMCATHKDCTCQHSEHSSSICRHKPPSSGWRHHEVANNIDKTKTRSSIPRRWQTTSDWQACTKINHCATGYAQPSWWGNQDFGSQNPPLSPPPSLSRPESNRKRES